MQEYKNSKELQKKIYKEAFRVFTTGYNQGLKAAHDAPSVLLADLRAPKFDFDGNEVHYEEDDNPLAKNPPPLPPT